MEGLVKRAMSYDSTWDRSAESYLTLYQEALTERALRQAGTKQDRKDAESERKAIT